MTLKELKTYVNNLPAEMDEFMVVNGEMMATKENKTAILVNRPIIMLYADKNNNEIQLFHQTEQDVKKILLNGAA
jgi:hypothetical protein